MVLETMLLRVRISPGAPDICDCGEIGILSRLKICRRKPCRFESGQSHHTPVGKLAKPSLSKGEALWVRIPAGVPFNGIRNRLYKSLQITEGYLGWAQHCLENRWTARAVGVRFYHPSSILNLNQSGELDEWTKSLSC